MEVQGYAPQNDDDGISGGDASTALAPSNKAELQAMRKMANGQLELASCFGQDKMIQIHCRMGVAATRPLHHCLAQGLEAVKKLANAVQRNSDLAHEHWMDTVNDILSMLCDKEKLSSFAIIGGEGKCPTIPALRVDDMQNYLAKKGACVATTVVAHYCWAMKYHSTTMPDASFGSLSTNASEAKLTMKKSKCMYEAIVDAEVRADQADDGTPYLQILPEVLKDVAWNQHINMHTHKFDVGGVSQPGNCFVLFVCVSG